LSCIANKLPIVAATKQAFAFEEEFSTADGKTRCWVTLLPFSVNGTWIDYVYGFVTVQSDSESAETGNDEPENDESREIESADVETDLAGGVEVDGEVAESESGLVCEAPADVEDHANHIAEPEPEAEWAQPEEADATVTLTNGSGPSFSAKLMGSLASVKGFYGRVADVEPSFPAMPIAQDEIAPEEIARTEITPEAIAPEDIAEEFAPDEVGEPVETMEEPLQTKLADVRAKADEARMAKLRSNAALYEGLSAAYDFALDAEATPEEYLRLVEEQGLKIQLRSPMAPVVKLAFDGLCDDATIGQLEAVLAWALKMDLPRGSLGERIEAEGGLGPILNGLARAA
jgi:hypothetical protein